MVHICRSQVLKVCVVRVIYVYHIYVCMCVYVTLIWTVEMKEDLVTCATYSFNIDVTANWILTAEISQRKTTKHNKVVEHMQLSLDDKLSLHQHGSYNTCVLCMYLCVYRSGKLGLFSTARNVPRKVRNQKIWFPNSSFDWSFFAFTPLKYESLINFNN